MVASINYLYSQITKESSHIISLYNRVKSGAEGVKCDHCTVMKVLLKEVVFYVLRKHTMERSHLNVISVIDVILKNAVLYVIREYTVEKSQFPNIIPFFKSEKSLD